MLWGAELSGPMACRGWGEGGAKGRRRLSHHSGMGPSGTGVWATLHEERTVLESGKRPDVKNRQRKIRWGKENKGWEGKMQEKYWAFKR